MGTTVNVGQATCPSCFVDGRVPMASQRSYRPMPSYSCRPLPEYRAALGWRPVPDGMAAAVASDDGTTLISIYRRVEFGGDGADTAAPMYVVSVDGDVDLDTAPALEQAL